MLALSEKNEVHFTPASRGGESRKSSTNGEWHSNKLFLAKRFEFLPWQLQRLLHFKWNFTSVVWRYDKQLKAISQRFAEPSPAVANHRDVKLTYPYFGTCKLDYNGLRISLDIHSMFELQRVLFFKGSVETFELNFYNYTHQLQYS